MSALKGLLRGAIVLLLILALLSYVLPRHVRVERSIVIAAPAATLFAYLNDLREFNKWSPWAQIDAETTYTFSGPPTGVGAAMTWHSEHPHVGSGGQQILESVPNEHVTALLRFGEQRDAQSRWSLVPEQNGTRVNWIFDTDLGFNPLARYFGLMLDTMVGSNYEVGLANLKSLAEAPAKPQDPTTPAEGTN